jgi:predicted Zn finger-like uncharacterized protein
MSTWEEKDLENIVCPKCHTEYKVTFTSLPLREEDLFKCSCGNILKKWKTTGMYDFTKTTK